MPDITFYHGLLTRNRICVRMEFDIWMSTLGFRFVRDHKFILNADAYVVTFGHGAIRTATLLPASLVMTSQTSKITGLSLVRMSIISARYCLPELHNIILRQAFCNDNVSFQVARLYSWPTLTSSQSTTLDGTKC
ncbi:hypothetical protein WAI453_005356 [Rhynchosporium graminicola]